MTSARVGYFSSYVLFVGRIFLLWQTHTQRSYEHQMHWHVTMPEKWVWNPPLFGA